MTYEPAVIFSDAGEWDRTAEEWKTLDFLAWLYNSAPNKDEVVASHACDVNIIDLRD